MGIQQRGQWGLIGDRRDEREFEIEVIEDPVVSSSESLEFELEVSCTEPLKESDFVVVQKGPLENIGDPLALLCMRRRVVNVAGNGGLM